MENFRGLPGSIEIQGISVGMSNSNQNYRPFVPHRDIMHPVFSQIGKHIAPRTRRIKFFTNKKNHKESNKHLENEKVHHTPT